MVEAGSQEQARSEAELLAAAVLQHLAL
ncbi:hypothetical protein KZ292_27110 [Escherichia coli]|nr:hypothetical protein [Escherichia coli]